jgi:glutamate/tyrosine decarboxylase-like PLP-dependent enzyme
MELLAPVAMNICCFRYVDPALGSQELDRLNNEIVIQLQLQGIAAPSTTIIHGKTAIRVNITNHRTTDADLQLLLREVERIGAWLSADADGVLSGPAPTAPAEE